MSLPFPVRARRPVPRALATAVLVAIALLASACSGGSSHQLTGYERTPAPVVGDLSLPAVDADGTTRNFPLVAPPRGLLLMYFGYTSCPDVCPTTLSDLRRAFNQLGSKADRLTLAMVTIDPDVDTAPVLAGYVRSFVPSAVALRTTDDTRLRPVATAFGADYGHQMVDGTSEVYHTPFVYAVDDQGKLLLTWPFGTTADSFSADLRLLLDRVAR